MADARVIHRDAAVILAAIIAMLQRAYRPFEALAQRIGDAPVTVNRSRKPPGIPTAAPAADVPENRHTCTVTCQKKARNPLKTLDVPARATPYVRAGAHLRALARPGAPAQARRPAARGHVRHVPGMRPPLRAFGRAGRCAHTCHTCRARCPTYAPLKKREVAA